MKRIILLILILLIASPVYSRDELIVDMNGNWGIRGENLSVMNYGNGESSWAVGDDQSTVVNNSDGSSDFIVGESGWINDEE